MILVIIFYYMHSYREYDFVQADPNHGRILVNNHDFMIINNTVCPILLREMPI